MKIFPTTAPAISGNRDQAFAAAYQKFYKPLFYLAYLKMKDYAGAGEVVKQVFTSVYCNKTINLESPELPPFLARKVKALCSNRNAATGSFLQEPLAPAENALSLKEPLPFN